MSCSVARRLLQAYRDAIQVAHQELDELLQAGMTLRVPRFADARESAMAANQAVLNAQRDYWNHVREHSCREPKGPNPQREIHERLRKAMLDARQLFDKAVEKYDHLTRLREDLAGQESGQEYARAARVRIQAYTVYLETLRRYADYAMSGDGPEEGFTGVSKQSKPN